MKATPLELLQAEAAAYFRRPDRPGFDNRALIDLNTFLTRAFDAGVKARMESERKTRETDPRTFEGRAVPPPKFYVSAERDSIESFDDESWPVSYNTADAAASAIVNGQHGDYGTRYVLRAKLSVEATYDRAWTLVQEINQPDEPATPPDSFEEYEQLPEF